MGKKDGPIINHAATCSDGDLKLVGGDSESEGRLEVCFNKRWGTVNGNGWTQIDTRVACKELGFPAQCMLNLTPFSIMGYIITAI